MDGCEIHFAPPKKPLNDEFPENTNKQQSQSWFPSGAKWISSIHSSFNRVSNLIADEKPLFRCSMARGNLMSRTQSAVKQSLGHDFMCPCQVVRLCNFRKAYDTSHYLDPYESFLDPTTRVPTWHRPRKGGRHAHRPRGSFTYRNTNRQYQKKHSAQTHVVNMDTCFSDSSKPQ